FHGGGLAVHINAEIVVAVVNDYRAGKIQQRQRTGGVFRLGGQLGNVNVVGARLGVNGVVNVGNLAVGGGTGFSQQTNQRRAVFIQRFAERGFIKGQQIIVVAVGVYTQLG